MAAKEPGSAMADSFAEYIGLSAPEVPKYLVLNNFLSSFFNVPAASSDSQVFRPEKVRKIDGNPRVFTQESDNAAKRQLEQSFAAYFDSYSGYSEYLSRARGGKKPWFYPVIPDMLFTTDQHHLRHLLYTLFAKSGGSYSEMQALLYNYLYGEGNLQDIHGIFKYICGKQADLSDVRLKEPPRRSFGTQAEQDFFSSLAIQFTNTMRKLLVSEYLLQSDFFTRIEFLSSFLAFFVMKYLLDRTNNHKSAKRGRVDNVFMCKGSADPEMLSAPLHKACISNYAGIRARFPELLKEQFTNNINQTLSGTLTLYKNPAGGELRISYQNSLARAQDEPLIDFLLNNKFASSRGDKAKGELIALYAELLQGEAQVSFDREEFALHCFNVQRKRSGSAITKIYSILPSMGREIGFVYPRNRAKQKYFALSEEFASFLVRLFLIEKGKTYAYYDDFTRWLNVECSIYFTHDSAGVLKNYLGTLNADVPMSDMNRNEQEFIKTLATANSLIRLSDSGHLVVLPERKGGLRLI